MVGGAAASRVPEHSEKRPAEPRFEGLDRPGQIAGDPLTEVSRSSPSPSLKLRVAEARIEDIGHGIARLAPADMLRMSAESGDVLKITGGTIAVARAEISGDGY